jgi:uncharacterized low-complexity protein
MSRLPALALASLLAVSFAAPAVANTADACKSGLAAASASMDAARARAKRAVAGEEFCAAHRRHFLEVAKARAVIALCKAGSERDQELGRLDGTVEDINGTIAARCGD